jgi:hypothetical protein
MEIIIVQSNLLSRAIYCPEQFIVQSNLLCRAIYCAEQFIVQSNLLYRAIYCAEQFILLFSRKLCDREEILTAYTDISFATFGFTLYGIPGI